VQSVRNGRKCYTRKNDGAGKTRLDNQVGTQKQKSGGELVRISGLLKNLDLRRRNGAPDTKGGAIRRKKAGLQEKTRLGAVKEEKREKKLTRQKRRVKNFKARTRRKSMMSKKGYFNKSTRLGPAG